MVSSMVLYLALVVAVLRLPKILVCIPLHIEISKKVIDISSTPQRVPGVIINKARIMTG